MSKAWEWMKAHPYATAAIIFAVGVLIILMFFRSAPVPADNSAADASAAAANAAASGNQLAGMQLQAQAAGNQTNAETAMHASDDATALAVATLSAQTSMSHDTLLAETQKSVAEFGFKTSEVVSTSAVKLAANNNSTSLLQSLLNKMGMLDNIGTTVNGLPTGANLTGAFDFGINPGGGLTGSFNVAQQPNVVTQWGMPIFVKDPNGKVYYAPSAVKDSYGSYQPAPNANDGDSHLQIGNIFNGGIIA